MDHHVDFQNILTVGSWPYPKRLIRPLCPPHPLQTPLSRFSPFGWVPHWQNVWIEKTYLQKNAYIEVALYLSINVASSTGATLILPHCTGLNLLCTHIQKYTQYTHIYKHTQTPYKLVLYLIYCRRLRRLWRYLYSLCIYVRWIDR